VCEDVKPDTTAPGLIVPVKELAQPVGCGTYERLNKEVHILVPVIMHDETLVTMGTTHQTVVDIQRRFDTISTQVFPDEEKTGFGKVFNSLLIEGGQGCDFDVTNVWRYRLRCLRRFDGERKSEKCSE